MADGSDYFPERYFPSAYWPTGFWYIASGTFVIGPWLGFNPKWPVDERYAPGATPVDQPSSGFDVVEMNP